MSVEIDQNDRGFANPVYDSQYAFRQILEAMASPGSIKYLALCHPQEFVNTASLSILLTLLDYDTPLWLDAHIASNEKLVNYLRFHCGSPLIADPGAASFALVTDAEAWVPLDNFFAGTEEYPDKSTTVIIQVTDISTESGWKLKGPGIESYNRLWVEGLPEAFFDQWEQQRQRFPLGIDLVFTCGDSIVALPRTTRLEF